MIRLSASDVRRLNWFGAKPVIAGVLAAPAVNPVALFIARAALPKRVAHRLPLSKPHVDYRLENGETVRLLEPLHDIVARDLHWGGGQPTVAAERRKLRSIERLCEGAATFLDVGAYAGFYALIAARSNPNLKAIAYEIVPENYFLMQRNIVANDLVGRVEARLTGIGEDDATIRLPTSMGAASLMTSMSLGSAFEEGVAIPVRTLDVETRNLPGPFMMKIDVEGYEAQVFAGGRTFFEKHRPDIVCEVLPDAADACRAIAKIVRPLGYRTFVYEDDGTPEHETIAPTALPRDWLLTTRSDVERFL